MRCRNERERVKVKLREEWGRIDIEEQRWDNISARRELYIAVPRGERVRVVSSR